MSRPSSDRLDDIRDAIARCRQYAVDITSEDVRVAAMALDAIVRNIMVIGEAANHLPDSVTSAMSEIDWPAVRGMRNILIHEYFRIDYAIVRDVIEKELLPLDNAIAAYQTTLS